MHLQKSKLLTVSTFIVLSIIIFVKLTLKKDLPYNESLHQREKKNLEITSIETTSTPNYYSMSEQKRFPKCLIIGFSKCGTHALRTFLSLHPEVVVASKEVGYFNTNYDKGHDWYKEQMPLSFANQITIEKTPSYILDKAALERIEKFDPGIKLIVIVRDPVIRLQSLYARDRELSLRKDIQFNVTFSDWVEKKLEINSFRTLEQYTHHIRNVFQWFPKKNVLILDGELLQHNPVKVLKQCEDFLQLEPLFSDHSLIYNSEKGFYCINTSNPTFEKMIFRANKLDGDSGCFTDSKGRSHPLFKQEEKNRMSKLFQPHNTELFELIGKRFMSWTSSN